MIGPGRRSTFGLPGGFGNGGVGVEVFEVDVDNVGGGEAKMRVVVLNVSRDDEPQGSACTSINSFLCLKANVVGWYTPTGKDLKERDE